MPMIRHSDILLVPLALRPREGSSRWSDGARISGYRALRPNDNGKSASTSGLWCELEVIRFCRLWREQFRPLASRLRQRHRDAAR